MQQPTGFDYKTLFESAFSSASIGMAFVMPDGTWLKVNQALCDMLGYSEEEMLKIDFQTITHAEDLQQDMQFVNMCLGGATQNYRMEKRYIHKKGHVLWAILSVALVRDEQNQPKFFISQVQDITELKLGQLALIQNTKMMALGEIAAGIAHEINNPLAIISLNVSAIKHLLGEPTLDRPLMSHFLDKTESTVRRITNITNSLRKISHNSSVLYQKTKLDDIFEDAFNLAIETLLDRSIVLVKKIESHIELECRPVEITQVLVNLLNNSIYALKDQLVKEITVEARLLDHVVTISVADTGPGVPQEVRAKIMDPFFTTKPLGEGSGLGLSISHKIISDHKGAFYLAEVQTGTKFVIELPQNANM